MTTYAIKGIPFTPGAEIPIRQEIDTWFSNPENAIQVSLFIQALTKFQKMKFSDKLSYFSVAGIHGFPVIPWDGVPGGFYCAHNRITFPTWHRPYILLYEQRIYEVMLEVIEETVPPQDKPLWKDAATRWRLPYWDWAAKQPYIKDYGVPRVFTLEQVAIVTPLPPGTTEGKYAQGIPVGPPVIEKIVDNPLWKFTNPAGPNVPMGDTTVMGPYAIQADGDLPWDKCIGTSRYGIVGTDPAVWAKGVNNWKSSNAAMQNPQWYEGNPGSISEAVYRLFTEDYFKSWQTFASTRHHNLVRPSDYLSLEYIHNNIHVWVGGFDPVQAGAGHMSDVPVAAFDPIFWLHHCNVDRQFALFQALNPDKWFDNSLPSDDKPTDPLLPFHYDTQSHLYDSDRTRNWRDLGYDYDIFVPVRDDHGNLDRSDGLGELKRRLNRLYSSTRHDLKDSPQLEGGHNDYIINIIYDRYGLGGRAYTIHFFIGAPPAEVSSYSQHTNHIGSVYTFSSPVELQNESHCENCIAQKASGVLSKAQIPITSVLLNHALDENRHAIETLKPADVNHYLISQLEWVIVEGASGRVIDINQYLPRTKVIVLQGKGEHPASDTELSRYHEYSPLWEPTQGKPGGAGPNDEIVTA
jgi:tyrosinase